MEKYRPKTPAAAFADRILRILLTTGAGMLWFILLWGVTLPALTAGIALGGLIWLCTRQFGKRITMRREKQMRRIIGGELELKKLLLLSPRHAAFQAALWIAPAFPAELHKALPWGVAGTLEGKSVWIRLIAQHESQTVSVQQVVECAREIHEGKYESCILCLTAPASREALQYAGENTPPIRIVSRQELIDWAGLCSPASDEDLTRLGRQKQTRRSAQEWLAVILDASRARRYLCYGLSLAVLEVLTRSGSYALPAVLCLVLYLACRLDALRRRHWQARSTH